MKNIFIIQLSEDGLNNRACTNVKALWNEIAETGYEPKTIEHYNADTKKVELKKYSYPNLLNEIKFSQAQNRLRVCSISCAAGEIEISQIRLR